MEKEGGGNMLIKPIKVYVPVGYSLGRGVGVEGVQLIK